MKRITAFVLILLVTTTLFASTEFSFSGTYALIGANGRTIRKTKAEIGEGLFLATGNEPVAAESKEFTLFLKGNSLVALSEDDSSLVTYLVYGISSVVIKEKLEKPMNVYTPTTLVTIQDTGEYCFISTDDDEIIYNFSTKRLGAYDAILGNKVGVREAEGFDYIHRRRVELDYSYKMTEGEMEEVIRIPAAPVFSTPLQKIVDNIPPTPKFATVDQELVTDTPEAPTFHSVAQSLMNNAPEAPVFAETKQEVIATPVKTVTITVTQTLEDDGND